MQKFVRYTILVLLIGTSVLIAGRAVYAVPATSFAYVHQDSLKTDARKTVAQESPRTSRSFFSSWFFQPFRSAPQETEKVLSNVKIFPNPTVESINLSFRMGKRAEVSIKVMDALGNELFVLLNQTLESGNQNHSFEIKNKLTAGLYFVRITAGAETVVKRISVL